MQPSDEAGPGLVGELVREGDYWKVVFAERELRARDSKGMRYLAELLARPGIDITALELAGGNAAGGIAVAEAAQAGLAPDTGAVGAPLLDAEAKAAYRVRLDELRTEIDEAKALRDPERVAQAEAEYAFVTDELSAAIGLSGRDRRTGTPQERARVNVTRTIKATIAHLAEHEPELGEHLAACVHTGRICSYRADGVAPVSWDVSTRQPRRREAAPFQPPETLYASNGDVNIAYQGLVHK